MAVGDSGDRVSVVKRASNAMGLGDFTAPKPWVRVLEHTFDPTAGPCVHVCPPWLRPEFGRASRRYAGIEIPTSTGVHPSWPSGHEVLTPPSLSSFQTRRGRSKSGATWRGSTRRRSRPLSWWLSIGKPVSERLTRVDSTIASYWYFMRSWTRYLRIPYTVVSVSPGELVSSSSPSPPQKDRSGSVGKSSAA